MYLIIFLSVISVFLYFTILKYKDFVGNFLNVMDKPNKKRKIHKKSIPKTASYPILLTVIVYLSLNIFFDLFKSDYNLILLGSICIFLVGFLDDRYDLSASKKTLILSLIIIFVCLVNDELIIKEFYLFHLDFFFKLQNFSIIFTVLCVLALINALNLADGINGLAIGIIFFWLCYIFYIYGQKLEIIIYLIFANLLFSFYHNLKGYHFLGDAGSLMLSSFVAFLIIKLHNDNIWDPKHQTSSENILIIFLIPILDMIRLFFERILNKKNPVSADNNHLHHLFLKKHSIGLCLVIYFLLINVPILISLHTSIMKYSIIASVIFIYTILVFYYKTFSKS
tara:strand:+ start:26 stop:1039 length:1014 start_codon:yes stop_codon:yes gene_type:complete